MSCEGSAKRAFGPCQSSSGPTASQPIRADPQCPCLQHRCHHSSQSLVLPFQGYSDPCPTSPATRGFALPGSHVHCHCPSGHRAPHCPAPSVFSAQLMPPRVPCCAQETATCQIWVQPEVASAVRSPFSLPACSRSSCRDPEHSAGLARGGQAVTGASGQQ